MGGAFRSPSPDETWLAPGPGEGLVKLWDTATGKLIGTLEGKIENGIEALALSRDTRWLAAGGDDNKVKRWRLRQDPSIPPSLSHPIASHPLLTYI